MEKAQNHNKVIAERPSGGTNRWALRNLSVGEYAKGDFTEGAEAEAVNKRFNEELGRQIAGTLPKDHTYRLGNAGKVLQSAGLPDLPIELRASRLYEKSKQENHPFELADIRNLPGEVQHPLAVFASATHPDTFVALTELRKRDKNYVVAIQGSRREGALMINSIRSLFPGKSRQVVSWINRGLLRYADKKEMVDWLSKQRVNSADVGKPLDQSTQKPVGSPNPSPIPGMLENPTDHAINIIKNFENVKKKK